MIKKMQSRVEKSKKEFDLCHSQWQHYQVLMQERESQFDTLQALKKCSASDPSQIELLKKSLKEIDTTLDLIGEEKERELFQSKQNLLDAIEQHFPDSFVQYSTTEKALKETGKHYERLIEQHKLLLPLLHLLQSGAQIPLTPRFRISFLLGRHPKAMLARRIHQAATVAETHLSQIHDVRFRLFIERFLQDAKDPSNTTLYQGKFSLFATEFSTLMSELTQEIAESAEAKSAHEKALTAWLTRH